MTKDNILYAIIGVLLGFIVGFMFANNANQRGNVAPVASAGQGMAGLPPDHPPLQSNAVAAQSQGQMLPEVQAAIKLAKDQPNNFDAQMKVAELYYQIQRYDDAIEYLKRANSLRPDAYEPVVNLGNVYFDAGRYDDAEKWYLAALAKKPDDVNVRTDLGLTFFFKTPSDVDRAIKEYRAALEKDPKHVQALQNLTVALIKKGDTEQAAATLARLEQADPNNAALGKLRADLAAAKNPR